MLGIAGMLELAGGPYLPGLLLRAMTGAPGTVGPDGPPDYQAPGVGLGMRHPAGAGRTASSRRET